MHFTCLHIITIPAINIVIIPTYQPSAEGMDYQALSGSDALLSWTSNNNRSCVRVTVLDDDMVENEELFFVNVVRVVESSPPVFPTFPPGTIVMIMNDDGSFCSYLPVLYIH